MGVRRRIYNLINEKIPSWANAVTRYEGVVTVLDQELKGTARFAKKLGWPLPVWVCDTSTLMTAPSTNASTYIDVEPNTWIQPGARIRLDNRYDVTVTDVTNSGSRVHLAFPLEPVFPSGTEVTVHSYPLIVVGDYTLPVQVFVVQSPYPLYVGDVLLLPPSNQPVEVTNVLIGGMVDGVQSYQVTLSVPVDIALSNGQDDLSLFAYPAYSSTTFLLPNEQPCVIDRVSGVFYTDMTDVREVDTVTLLDAAIAPIATYSTASKNFPVQRIDIPADFFLFGRRMEGVFKWDSARNCVVMQPDSNLRSQLRYTFEPPWSGQAAGWQVQFDTTGPVKVAVFMGQTRTLVTIPAAGSYIVTVPMPSHTVDVITITAEYDAQDTVLSMFDWILTQTPVRMVRSTTVAHIQGLWIWGSTGLLHKRALRLSDVTAYADMSGTLSSGYFA